MRRREGRRIGKYETTYTQPHICKRGGDIRDEMCDLGADNWANFNLSVSTQTIQHTITDYTVSSPFTDISETLEFGVLHALSFYHLHSFSIVPIDTKGVPLTSKFHNCDRKKISLYTVASQSTCISR